MRIESTDRAASSLPVQAEVRGSDTPRGVAPQESPFGALMTHALGESNALDQSASAKVDALVSGASDDIHGTMIAVKEAEISVKLLGSIRNHLLDAFHEIWRTSV